ncbi:hypothetical protein [Deinococcus soli (ex Cha et al. 2016)]|uniref:Thioester reductase-like protein n=1 Tax=Deinococcus soli (ex Cha et al. 2016) TaxID=1309411 RepID=A0AAE3XE36_9DEIO|nr:hypothetical protein [Deinococcus soli (ex Cha et al. 2016)]MDR6218807.1 thioester reductase-like protein [Deinococcus soli (ex Cha et al. 2016)]MDR6328604.1 thioester reductase-like protein [Deinococcus soli (ex Cha et al. 2016)]
MKHNVSALVTLRNCKLTVPVEAASEEEATEKLRAAIEGGWHGDLVLAAAAANGDMDVTDVFIDD